MRKQYSKTRRRYKHLCGQIRRNGGFPFPPKPYQDYDEIEDAVILTYDYFDSQFTGWINSQRRHDFITLRYRLFEAHGLPF